MIRCAWLKGNSGRDDRYNEFKAGAGSEFYRSSPFVVAGAVADAMRYLTESDAQVTEYSAD